MQDNEEIKLNTEEGETVNENLPAAETEKAETETVETVTETTESSETVETAEVTENTQTVETAEGKEKKKRDKAAEAEEALKSFEDRTVEPPKKKKFGWLSYVFLVAVIGFSLWLIFSNILGDMGDMDEDGPQSIGAVIRGASWQFALVALAVFIVILTCNWFKYVVVMKTTTGKCRLGTSLKAQLLGRFYDNVTPFAVGGQPMQIYYLHKKGISGGTSSAIVLIKYFTDMFCGCFISLIFMACNTAVLNGIDETYKIIIMVCGWIGVAANLFMPIMIILFVIFPKFSRKLATFVINIGYKLKIVKDKEKKLQNALKVVEDFRAAVKIMSKTPLNFFALIMLCVTESLFRYSLPFWIMKMYKPDISFEHLIPVMALNIYASQAVALIPTPGNSGAIEFSSLSAFTAVLSTGPVLSWSVFTWRLCMYYFYIVVGLGFTIFDFTRKIVRNKKQKKESAL